MRKLLFLLFVVLSSAAMSAPVWNKPVTIVQPNGDTLQCFVSGDEFFHRLHDADGYTIVRNTTTGEYVYATLVEGDLAPTTLLVGHNDPRSAGLTANLMPDALHLKQLHDAWKVPEKYLPPAPKTSGRNHGTMNNVVIFIRFSDETTCTSSSFSTINSMFNDSTAGAVSMYNYFWHSSYHNLRIITQYYPTPSGSTVLSYQDDHPRSYYEPFNAVTNPNGYTNNTVRVQREFTLLESAVNWVNTNSPVPSNINIDMDNDNYVDNICFVVSGTYTGWNDLLWPHKWSLYDRYVYLNGKRVYTFNLQLAGSGSHYFSVSTFCHEMTHTLGAPDIYHYNNYTEVSPGGSWDLMNSNQTPPQQTNSFFKLYYLNWFDDIPLIEDSGRYTLTSLVSGPNNAYKIPSANPHEWYILEYRNNTDTFDSSIPNRGMLIWRYNDLPTADNSMFDFTDTVNQLWLFRPNSNIDTVNGTPASAAFGVNNRTHFDSTSNPRPYLCDGTLDNSFSITDIQISSDHQSVSFTYNPNWSSPCAVVSSFPDTLGFENLTEECWNFISNNSSNISNAGVTDYLSSNFQPHTGEYMFAFSSYHSASDYNQYLVSPRLQHTHPLHFQFYYRRAQAGTEKFRVLASSTTRSLSDFSDTLCDITVNQSGWHDCHVLVPPTAKYVAINYYSNFKYYLFVDDLELRDSLYGPNDTVIRDTTYIYVQDTLTHYIYDTSIVWVHDTITHITHDTLYEHVTDTLYYPVVDTAWVTVYDTNIIVPATHEVMIVANESERGKASGSGHFLHNTHLEIAAIPKAGFRFDHWMDGNQENPRTIVVDNDLLFSAFFVPDNGMPPASAKNIIFLHDTIFIHDTVWETAHTTVYVVMHDTTWTSGRDTIIVYLRDTLMLPMHDTLAIETHQPFDYDTTHYYSLSILSNNEAMGLAAGSGLFPMGTAVQLGAVAAPGHHLVQWSDGTTDNPKTIIVDGDLTFVATFDEGVPMAIDPGAEAVTHLVYTQGQRIAVKAAANQPITVFNTIGQCLFSRSGQSDGTTVTTLTQPLRPGLYMVRVGTAPAHKVIILN